MGPGVAGECQECNGLHVNEDHFLVEILDPETLEPVAPGEVGEVVITTLTKEAFPVIRYRTRDLSHFIPETCPCGRTSVRMHRMMGRSDDMLIIKGVNVFPTQIETVLFETYTTIGDVITAINLISGWESESVLSEYDNIISTELVDRFAGNTIDNNYI